MGINAVADIGTAYQVMLADGTVLFVPKHISNSDYVRVQDWITSGGVVS
jgi:hypothetical protein